MLCTNDISHYSHQLDHSFVLSNSSTLAVQHITQYAPRKC